MGLVALPAAARRAGLTMRLAWALGVAALLQFAALAWWLRGLEPTVLALQWTFTPEGFAQVLQAWSDADRARFLAHLPWDMALLLTYAAFGLRLAAHAPALHRVGPAARALARVALPAAAVFDAVENLLHAQLVPATGPGPAWLHALAGGSAALKWAGVASCLLVWAWVIGAGGRRGVPGRH